MNERLNDPLPSTTNNDLEQQVAALQRQILILLVALIVLAATVTGFLYYQSHVGSNDLNLARPHYMAMIAHYEQIQPVIEKFDRQLIDFGATHSSFQPILQKYGLEKAAPKGLMAPAP
ncbi:MAG: hypothetical protein ACREFR_20025 [Limisphaerales bacterium]